MVEENYTKKLIQPFNNDFRIGITERDIELLAYFDLYCDKCALYVNGNVGNDWRILKKQLDGLEICG
ncbi:MAG: hypothetical protein ACETVY_02670 [Candidatus Bathyarchaeia archaeon]